MVALAGVLHGQLPVAAFHQGAFVSDLGVAQIVGREHGFEPATEVGDVGRIVGEADVENAADVLDVDPRKAVIGRLEGVGHAGGDGQLAAQLVGPAVIGADQAGSRALAGLADLRAPMAAGVVEGMQLAMAVARDDHRPGSDRYGHPGTRAGQLDREADHQPRAPEDRRHVEIEGALTVVEILGEAVARPALVQQARENLPGSNIGHPSELADDLARGSRKRRAPMVFEGRAMTAIAVAEKARAASPALRWYIPRRDVPRLYDQHRRPLCHVDGARADPPRAKTDRRRCRLSHRHVARSLLRDAGYPGLHGPADQAEVGETSWRSPWSPGQ